MEEFPGDAAPTCSICMQPIATSMLRVLVWGLDQPLAQVPENATEEEATFAVAHRECFEKVMHPNYSL